MNTPDQQLQPPPPKRPTLDAVQSLLREAVRLEEQILKQQKQPQNQQSKQ